LHFFEEINTFIQQGSITFIMLQFYSSKDKQKQKYEASHW